MPQLLCEINMFVLFFSGKVVIQSHFVLQAVLTVMSDLLMVLISMRAVWRSVWTVSGGQCAMTSGALRMLRLCAAN